MIAHVILDHFSSAPNTTLDMELAEQGIDAEIWIAEHDPNDVVGSIGRSHKKIIQHAKEAGLKQVCILEEDVMFLGPKAWEHFLYNIPKDFDLYLGGCYGLRQLTYQRIASHEGPVEIHNFAGLHCYIINESYYDKFLSLPENKHIDDQPGMGRFYVCSPFVALQHPGFSSNHKTKVNYNINIPKECLYHGQG